MKDKKQDGGHHWGKSERQDGGRRFSRPYADPTADMAVANVTREERMKKKAAERRRGEGCHEKGMLHDEER